MHIPVLKEEVISALQPALGAGSRHLDGTLGLAGHAKALLEAVPGLQLCGLDRDAQALTLATENLQAFAGQIHLHKSCFAEFGQVLEALAWSSVDSALIDIGVSSLQLDLAERGFSFRADAPLDMRMDQSSGQPASVLVNRSRYEELVEIIDKYGEEPLAQRISRSIVEARAKKPFETTLELAKVVEAAYPAAWRAKARNHPATRTFQALRMVVNDELGELERFLDGILAKLAPRGRLAVLSFHSLEDRLIKHKMRLWATDCICSKQLPICVCKHRAEVKLITKKPITASQLELRQNPRSSSAKLRVVEKLDRATGQLAGAME